MNKENIARVLKEFRKKNALSVPDVVILLEQRQVPVAAKTIYGWESGQALPSADTLLMLCEMYNINHVLETFGYKSGPTFYVTSEEENLIRSYRDHKDIQPAVKKLLDIE